MLKVRHRNGKGKFVKYSRLTPVTKMVLLLLIFPAFPEKTSSTKLFQLKDRTAFHPKRVIPQRFNFKPPLSSNEWRPVTTPPHQTPRSPPPQPEYRQEQGIVVLRHVATLPPKLAYKPRPLAGKQATAFRPNGGTTLQLPSQFSTHPYYGSSHQSQPPLQGETNKCKGRKNLIDDIGVLSLITAMTSSTFGMYTIIVNSMTSNSVGIISSILSLMIWLPSELITVLDKSGPHIYTISNFLNGLSFINTMYSFLGVIFGTADVLFSTAGETIGVISLALSVLATFPDYLDAIIEALYRMTNNRKMQYYIENYGCSVPSLFRPIKGQTLFNRINNFLISTTKKIKRLDSKVDSVYKIKQFP